MNQNLFPLALLILLILGGGFLFLNKPIIKTQTSFSFDINSLTKNSVPLGNPNAPVKIIVFSDFQCPFCKKLYFETIKRIKEDYIDKNLAVLYYKEFAILGKESIDAALASKCAKAENKYWEYVDLLFNSQAGENIGSFSEENLIKLAENLGLDKEKFKKCLEEKQYINEVQDDINQGVSLNVRGTPYIIINNDVIEGAYPYSEFQKIINKYLKK